MALQLRGNVAFKLRRQGGACLSLKLTNEPVLYILSEENLIKIHYGNIVAPYRPHKTRILNYIRHPRDTQESVPKRDKGGD